MLVLFWGLGFMKIQIIAILIILSFIFPSLHFINHEHNYNPFTKKVEHIHQENELSHAKVKSSSFSHFDKEEEKNEIDICKIILNNKVYKKSEYSPIVKTLIVNKYIYLSYYSTKNKKSSKILFIAPKNSPPYFS